MQLSNKQIKYLRGLAHDLKPVVMIGANGLSDNVSDEIEGALRFHELIKIKINEGDDREAIVEQICQRQKATHIQSIGKMVVLFRRNPEKPKVEIPKI
ncbi:MAG: ribosome assembly RNA-binding protein YhbY [Pseudomonadota bacterium]